MSLLISCWHVRSFSWIPSTHVERLGTTTCIWNLSPGPGGLGWAEIDRFRELTGQPAQLSWWSPDARKEPVSQSKVKSDWERHNRDVDLWLLHPYVHEHEYKHILSYTQRVCLKVAMRSVRTRKAKTAGEAEMCLCEYLGLWLKLLHGQVTHTLVTDSFHPSILPPPLHIIMSKLCHFV